MFFLCWWFLEMWVLDKNVQVGVVLFIHEAATILHVAL
jgi:hypothetical protein